MAENNRMTPRIITCSRVCENKMNDIPIHLACSITCPLDQGQPLCT